ncbi:MAG: ATP-binding protein [Anaerolineaceae bacterium]|nr:ATP-binding protein [Anaerolineaceae bacterium]
MANQSKTSSSSSDRLNHYFSLLASTASWKGTLEELFLISRDDFIFDNLVIYQTDSETGLLEVLFARSTGRGKSAEADASWGESLANRIIQENHMICEEPDEKGHRDRLAQPYLLGLPINTEDKLPGVLVFIRFGGPTFSEDDCRFAQWTANLTTSIVRKKMLDEFMSKIEDIQSVTKLQADFISTISHELRSPLGFIKGYTTTLLRTDTNWDRETQKDFLEIIERETNNLTDLIEDLLDSSRLQSGQMKFDFHLVRIDSLIRDEVNRTHLTNPEQKIELDFETEIPVIEGDPRKLAQVFDNLLSNARKYAPEAMLQIRLRKEKKHLIIEFNDDGQGIPEVYQSRIFTRFFRVPEQSMKAHGTGLGLFICKQIIENHEGTIHVSSSQDGTSFKISLPYALVTKKLTAEESV